ncbi:hypothetical protein C8F04DRAFT_1173432 [Mycena alexandri]|uniref:Uncharacterized protein n=1 Tax=Mycena alexandri TaxID=1745969 RepID=A0AAD6THF9_9AGAR|nr:hypothetical protein C8F04DRAFT_1173432 [Mycena alexandri]
MGSSYALTRSSSSLRTLRRTQLNTKFDAMSSNAGPSSSRQTSSRATRSLPQKSPATLSTVLPATGDFASPAAPRLRVGAEPVNVNTAFLQANYTGREIVSLFKLRSDVDHPRFLNLLDVQNTLGHMQMVAESLADRLAELDENPPTLADLRSRPVRATAVPPAPLPSPPVLPPLIPDSDAPHNPTDELDEAAEEELAEFSRKRQAQFDERKALRDNYRATCERVQREHKAAFWAEQDRLQEYWENENVAHLDDLAAYDEERARVVSSLEELADSWLAFLQRYLRVARLLLRYGTRKAVKFPKPCAPCSKTGCPCFTDPERTQVSCTTCVVGKMKCVPSGSNTSVHIACVRIPLRPRPWPPRPRLRRAVRFNKWYPPHFDYRTRAEKRKGIPFLFSKADAAKGGAVDSVGSGDARSEAEDEDEKEEEEDAMEVDDAAPPIATLSGSSKSPTRSSARASTGASKTAQGASAPAPAAVPSSRPPVASSLCVRLEDAPLPPAEFTFTAATLLGGSSGHVPPHATYAERNLRARDDFSLVVPPDSCFGKLRPWNILQEEYPLEVSVPRYHARRSWILHWAAEMDRMAIYTAGREFMAALVRDSSPSVDFPSEYLSLPIVYGNVPYPCPVPSSPTTRNGIRWRCTRRARLRKRWSTHAQRWTRIR